MAEGTILLYHGVTDAHSNGVENFSGKHVPVEIFEAQMHTVASRCEPVSLRTMSQNLKQGEHLGEKAVAVTFDDSYENV